MSMLRVGMMASNILKSFPNLGMSNNRQEGAWWGDQFTPSYQLLVFQVTQKVTKNKQTN